MAIKRVNKLHILRAKEEKSGGGGGTKGGANGEAPRKVRMSSTVWTERNIWSSLDAPFLVPLHHCFQDDNFLYFVMPFFPGGDLNLYVRNHGVMDEDICRFYAAEVSI